MEVLCMAYRGPPFPCVLTSLSSVHIKRETDLWCLSSSQKDPIRLELNPYLWLHLTLIISLEDQSLNTITLGVRVQHMNLERLGEHNSVHGTI